jgi:hypothetical protein
MARSDPLRITLLCEDRMHEQFFAAICEEHGWRVVDRHVAPRGRGSAEQWVRKQIYERVLQHRRWRRENRALLVGIDGDKVGVSSRRDELDSELRSWDQPAIAAGEGVAVLVPTWCIETWILFLHDGQVVPEDQDSKGLVPARLLASPKRGTLTSQAIRKVRLAWAQGDMHPDLPSLTDGRAECAQLTLAR